MNVSIIIVSYNSGHLLKKCLSSIFKKTRNVEFEVIVVDNNSKDIPLDYFSKLFPSIQIIKNKKNNFFSKANNQGSMKARGKYLLFLAPDSYLLNNACKIMFDFLESNPSYGACEGLEIYGNGKEVPTGSFKTSPVIDFFELSIIGGKLKNRKLINKFRMTRKKRTQDFDADVICDAFIMVRKELFIKIGMYDPNLKLYYTENDLCAKIKKEGYKIRHLGKPKIVHLVSSITNKLGWKKNEIYYEDLRNFYKKYNNQILGNMLYLDLVIEKKVLQVREIFKGIFNV